jgi:hypothetical protein
VRDQEGALFSISPSLYVIHLFSVIVPPTMCTAVYAMHKQRSTCQREKRCETY